MAVPDYENKVEWFAEQFTVRELLGLMPDADFEALYKKARDMAGPGERGRVREVELSDGGIIESDNDGTIRRRDKDGNMQDVVHLGDDDWQNLADYLDLTPEDFADLTDEDPDEEDGA